MRPSRIIGAPASCNTRARDPRALASDPPPCSASAYGPTAHGCVTSCRECVPSRIPPPQLVVKRVALDGHPPRRLHEPDELLDLLLRLGPGTRRVEDLFTDDRALD